MKKICFLLIMLCGLYAVPSYPDEIRLGIGLNLSEYPQLVLIPGYPVYYDPDLDANYFFYDGDYWLYQDDNWYESEWYDGPWRLVEPEDVPAFILRIPVRYYRVPPVYFFSWLPDEPPHWGEHWGHDWDEHRHGWNKWDHHIHVKPAPLPLYQRQYSGDRYPQQFEQQDQLQQRHYRYQPRDLLVRQRHQRLQAQHRTPDRHDEMRAPGNGGEMSREGERSMHQRPDKPFTERMEPGRAIISEPRGPIISEPRGQIIRGGEGGMRMQQDSGGGDRGMRGQERDRDDR